VALRSARSFLIPVLSAGLLAACATDQNAGFVPVAKTSTAPAAASAPAEPEVAALPPLPHVQAAEVLSFSRADLLHVFGSPAFRRVDKGAEILRFRGEDCLLDVYLYNDAETAPGNKIKEGGSGTARVAHFEARDADGKATDREACANRTPRERSRS
jgi:hypothetical protein